jgi:hypothetical protein
MTRADAHKVVDPMLPRKASKLQFVGDRTVNRLRWVRINVLRCLREHWLRNSAKLYRNFGRRYALIRCSDTHVKPKGVAEKWR